MRFGMPETHYARAHDGAYLAYQRFGEGPMTVVWVPGQASHLEHQWDFPIVTQHLRRMARFVEVLVFDPRGCGLSDRALGAPERFVEQFAGDIGAVMDAAGVERAALYTRFHGSPACIRLAVDRPDRVSHLVLDGAYARWRRAPDTPDGMREEVADRFVENVTDRWGTGATIAAFAPSLADDHRQREAWAQYERMSCSPGDVRALLERWTCQDVRDLLGRICVPALVIHRAQDQLVRVGHGRYLATHVPGARYVEAPEGDHIDVRGAEFDALGEIADFLVGARDLASTQRAVAAVLFLDVASSTEVASRIGDSAWRALLEDFRHMVRREVQRFGGREVNTRGDDFLVCFDLPSVAVAAARAIRDSVEDLGLSTRAGLHLGEVEVHDDDVSGLTVHIAARIEGLAGPGEIFVSATVADALAGSAVELADRGEHALKGVPGAWRVLEVR